MKSTTEYLIDDLKLLLNKTFNEIQKLEFLYETDDPKYDFGEDLSENRIDAKSLLYNMILLKLTEQQAIIKEQ